MKKTRSKKAKRGSITADAFLEAVLDCLGDEACVMARLEVNDKTLHAFMANNAALVTSTRQELWERDIDLTEPALGWLQLNDSIAETGTPDDWARYRELIEEETSIEAFEHLAIAKTKTEALVLKLQIAKQKNKKPKSRLQPYPIEPDSDIPADNEDSSFKNPGFKKQGFKKTGRPFGQSAVETEDV